MSFFDEMADLVDDLMGDDDFKSEATLVRVTKVYDKKTGKTSEQNQLLACLALLGARRSRNDAGVYLHEIVATLNVEPQINDVLQIGSFKHVVAAVETVAPNGRAIVWKAVMK